MLKPDTFIAGMALLQKAFIGWQFDVKDELQVKLWYSAFKALTDEQFNSLIKEYISNNNTPPKSIKELTDIYVEKQIKLTKIPPEKALPFVRNIVSERGGWGYGGKAEIYRDLLPYPALYATVREFEDTLKNMTANDHYAADRFRRAYEENLKKNASQRVNKFLGLSVSEDRSLGTAALPYET